MNKDLEANANEIIQMKQNGKLIREIAQYYNTSNSTIGRLLRKHGYGTRNKLTAKLINDIIDLYNAGDSIKTICSKLHFSDKTVSSVLKKNNIQFRSNEEINRKYYFNEHYFDCIDTQNKAYFLGLLYADGCNYMPKNNIILCLQEQDGYIIKKFNDELESTYPVSYIVKSTEDFNRQNQFRLSLTSKYLCEKLNAYGLIPNKSLSVEFPDWLSNEMYPHFIRGYFDGNGWLSKNPKEKRMNFCGSSSMCDSLQNILKEKLNVNSYISIPHNKTERSIRTLTIAGHNQVKTVLDYIYDNASLYLYRKHDIYTLIYSS